VGAEPCQSCEQLKQERDAFEHDVDVLKGMLFELLCDCPRTIENPLDPKNHMKLVGPRGGVHTICRYRRLMTDD